MFIFSNRVAAMAIVLGLSPQIPAQAFHVGLGNAAAAQGAKVVNKADSGFMDSNGVAVPKLPSCGSAMELFTAPPITDPSFISITPIGHVYPPGHTFPADHAYFGFTGASTGINLFSPADGWITQITTLYGAGHSADGFVINFSPCAEVTLMNLTVDTLAPALAQASGQTTCSPFGGNFPGAVASCVTTMELPVKAGDLLGTGGLGDFGPLVDTRSRIGGFIDPARHNLTRGFCPVNYFTPSLRSTYTAMLGINSGSTFIPRTTQPLCGTIMQDLAGTAQGDWFKPGAPYPPDDAHLALIHQNIFPSIGTFSSGTSIPGFTGTWDFFPRTSADSTRINYDFSLVNDTQIYCYDTFLFDLVGGAGSADPALAGDILLLQLSGSSLDTLKIELQHPSSTCTATAGSWALTSNAVTFQR